jgi:integrase
MRRVTGKLSAQRARTAKPKAGRRVLVIGDGGNLYLQCTLDDDGNVRRSWVFRYEINGKRREMGLGPLRDRSLAEARDKAEALRKQLLDDVDPLEAREADKRAKLTERARSVTFREDAEAYMALHEKGWSPKHAQQWRRSLERYVYPAIGNMPVSQIIPATLLRLVEPLWLKRTVTASRIVNRLENVLAYATTHDHRQGDNPAGNLLAALPKRSKVAAVENFAATPYAQIATVMARLQQIGTPAARALRFLIVTATRADEVLGCEWSEIDLAKATWVIPARRMKGRREHRVPLSAPAVRLLQGLPRKGKRPFPIDDHAMLRVLRKISAESTVHGMRSAFKQWAIECTAYPPNVSEAALAHKLASNPTEGAYLRDADLFEKRRRLMSAWADFCAKPMPATGAIVTRIREHA